MRSKLVSCWFLSMFLWTGIGSAEPLVITGGSGSFIQMGELTSFQLTAPGTTLAENARGSGFQLTFAPGESVAFQGGLNATPVPGQPPPGQTFNGTNYPDLFLRGSLMFAGDSFVAPSAAAMTRRRFETPMTMTGHLDAFSTFDGQGAPVFSVDVTGRGRLTFGEYIMLNDTGGGSAWTALPGAAASFVLEDSSVAPVPEPATMMLFGTGLAATALLARRRR